MDYTTLPSVYHSKHTLSAENLKVQPLYKEKRLTVGYLTAVKGDLKERQGLAVSGALTKALKEVIFVRQSTIRIFNHVSMYL